MFQNNTCVNNHDDLSTNPLELGRITSTYGSQHAANQYSLAWYNMLQLFFFFLFFLSTLDIKTTLGVYNQNYLQQRLRKKNKKKKKKNLWNPVDFKY